MGLGLGLGLGLRLGLGLGLGSGLGLGLGLAHLLEVAQRCGPQCLDELQIARREARLVRVRVRGRGRGRGRGKGMGRSRARGRGRGWGRVRVRREARLGPLGTAQVRGVATAGVEAAPPVSVATVSIDNHGKACRPRLCA